MKLILLKPDDANEEMYDYQCNLLLRLSQRNLFLMTYFYVFSFE
jgi:hypothetical protein